MRTFKIVVGVLASIPVITGLGDALIGLEMQRGIGARPPEAAFVDPLLQSQIRFLGAVWFGFGVLMFVFLRDLARYGGLLKIALATIFFGGIGRILAILTVGMPEPAVGQAFVIVVTLIEIVGMPLLYAWLVRLEAAGEAG